MIITVDLFGFPVNEREEGCYFQSWLALAIRTQTQAPISSGRSVLVGGALFFFILNTRHVSYPPL